MVKTTKAGATWALDYERLFERSDTDVLLLKLMIAAAFTPNYLVSEAEDARGMEYAMHAGISRKLNYEPFFTIVLKRFRTFA